MMSCIIVTCSEFANLNHLAVYSVFTNAIDASFGITTLIMLGHLGKGHLAAGVIALAFYNVSWYFIEGLLTAQDSLVARSFALNDRESARYWSYISCGVAILLCIPGTVLFIMAAIIIQYAFLIRAHTAVKAAEFLILLIPGLWAHSLFRVAQKYLQCQQKMVVPIICGLIGISANLLGSYLLSFVFGLGFSGCGIATTAARIVMLVCILSYICKNEDVGRAIEEITILGRSLRKQYENMDEVVDLTGSKTRKKSTLVTASSAKKSSRNKGKKVRIAPVAENFEEEINMNINIAAEGDIELTDIEAHAQSQDSTRNPLSGESEHLITDSAHSGRGGHNNEEEHAQHSPPSHAASSRSTSSGLVADLDGGEDGITADSLPPDAADGSDTQALLGGAGAGSIGSDARFVGAAPKKVIVADILRFLFLGIPGGMVLGMEFWIFEVVTVIVAHMGSVVVGTNQILLTITSFFFLSIPFALSIAATVQISRQLAKQRYKKARTTAYLCILEGSVLMASAAGILYFLSDYTGYIFTNNEDILNRLRTLAPYNAGFQVAYGVYGSAQGVLRATSHQLNLLGWTFISMWLVGLPLGMYLAFVTRPTYGLEGLWVGLIVGMGLLAFIVLLQVYLLDWEKEARKAEYRLRRGGVGNAVGVGIGAVGGNRRGARLDDLAIPGLSRLSSSMNPLRMAAEEHFSDVPLPTIGSRAAGGFPLDELFNPGEDLDELEYIEYGDTLPTGSAAGARSSGSGRHTVGGNSLAADIEMTRLARMPLPDDEEDFKRNK